MVPDDFRDLIRMVGGPARFRRRMGITLNQAKLMSSRNHIAPLYWEELIEMCKEEGIAVDAAWLFHQFSLRRGKWRRVPMEGAGR